MKRRRWVISRLMRVHKPSELDSDPYSEVSQMIFLKDDTQQECRTQILDSCRFSESKAAVPLRLDAALQAFARKQSKVLGVGMMLGNCSCFVISNLFSCPI